MRDDEREGYFLPTQKFEEQAVVLLHGGSDSAASDAKEEEVDATSVVQQRDELVGLFDGAKKGVDAHLGLVESDRIVDT